jgi:hypothetical protein
MEFSKEFKQYFYPIIVLLSVQTWMYAVPFFALLQPPPFFFLRQAIFMLFVQYVRRSEHFVFCLGLVIQYYFPVVHVWFFPVTGALYRELTFRGHGRISYFLLVLGRCNAPQVLFLCNYAYVAWIGNSRDIKSQHTFPQSVLHNRIKLLRCLRIHSRVHKFPAW